MTKTKKVLLAVLPAAALVIGGGVGVAVATGEPPVAPVTEQTQLRSTVQRHAPHNGDQVRLRDGTCDPVSDQFPMHDPIQHRDRLHDRLGDR